MAWDKIIIGAGLYGLYAAKACGERGERVLVLEWEAAPFKRATYINQARVHMGYHYPRSYATAIKSAHYFNRFIRDYDFCIHSEFEQVYATSGSFSWTNREQFVQFCRAAEIPCEEVVPEKYFKKGMCDGAFLTKEYTYDAAILGQFFMDAIEKLDNVEIRYGVRIRDIVRQRDVYEILLENGERVETGFLLNATYGSTNQILDLAGFEAFKIKYELCEIILCEAKEQLLDVGITVMDGPFFSIMPFGKTGSHSLTSVTFTPHVSSFESLPAFHCQARSGGYCTPQQLGNCNDCPAQPESAWPYMSSMARKYLKEAYGFSYTGSLFSMKPILKASEVDDSRPTVIRKASEKPTFVSVLSGKINTVYDLDEVLRND
ncbi:FAD-dependent oxidoreductase [Acetobacterium fimetarium]|uniref:FAD-dependent oxidoreductase n=1 Tax=Acetobacterium fimetarium TaxID=52691 RepID=A0ABR6WT11_9FIRM|nr:FAD-dependent oxidoreductase [Acetobacterium fimetarium]MBC3803648.1 FAD-dependent oxidoreductase [Acetobacterium fimetarium]